MACGVLRSRPLKSEWLRRLYVDGSIVRERGDVIALEDTKSDSISESRAKRIVRLARSSSTGRFQMGRILIVLTREIRGSDAAPEERERLHRIRTST